MIPLIDLKRQYRSLRSELRRAALRVLDSGRYILGPEGEAFEAEFARATGARHVIGVSSGTDALRLALEALGVGPGDEVVVPALTFIATATAVSAVGATPVFADVDPERLTLDPARAAKAAGSRAKALIPVHLYGNPADMDPLLALARRRGLKVVEDCAQAHGSSYKGRPAGALGGDITAFSFYPTKNLGAAGDAGALATQDKALGAVCRELRNVGRRPDSHYDHSRIGQNSRLDEIQAAVLRVKLKRLKAWTARRREIAVLYDEGLRGLPLQLPCRGQDGTEHAFHLYIIRCERRDALSKHLAASGIGSGVYYPKPLHLQPAYRALGYRAGDFPESERASRTVLALPMFPELSDAEVLRVCRAAAAFFKR